MAKLSVTVDLDDYPENITEVTPERIAADGRLVVGIQNLLNDTHGATVAAGLASINLSVDIGTTQVAVGHDDGPTPDPAPEG